MSGPSQTRLTLRHAWEQYRLLVISPEAGVVQLNEIKLAFYGGAVVMLEMMAAISALDDVAREAEYLKAIQAELNAFSIETATRAQLAEKARRQ